MRSSSTTARWRADLMPALNLVLFALSLFVLDRIFRTYPLEEILNAVRQLPIAALIAAIIVTFAGYLALIGYDYIAFRFAGLPLPLSQMLVPSFVCFAVSNSAPVSLVMAGGLRYKLYSSRGLKPTQATVVAGVNVVTYTLGLCALGGLALLLRPMISPLRATVVGTRVLGIVLLVAVLLYLLVPRAPSGQIKVLKRELHIPPRRMALWQLAISTGDWLLSSGALFLLIYSVTPIRYLDFLAAFLVAQFAALLLPIPGGIGVFEAVILLLRPHGTAPPYMLAALLAYRVIYFLLPLVIAAVLLGVREVARARTQPRPLHALIQRASAAVPHVLAFITFLSGLLLLVTGAVPPSGSRMSWLGEILPLSVIEVSHFVGSIVGALLIVVAWGLERRIRVAYRVVRLLFGVGIVLALLRSPDVRIAAGLGLAFIILTTADRQFPRTASLLREPIATGWIFVLGAVLLVNIWIATLVLRHGAMQGQTWWHFALSSHAPRYLRVAAAASVVILVFTIARLLARSAPDVDASTRAGDGGGRTNEMPWEEDSFGKFGGEDKRDRHDQHGH